MIDHLWTNIQDRIICHSNDTRAASDHNAISTLVRTKEKYMQRLEVLGRSWKQMDTQRAKDRIRSVDWTQLYESNNINTVNNIFETKILEVLDSEAPLKVTQFRKNYGHWVTDNLKAMMKNRDKKREQARITGDRTLWQEYKVARNEVTKTMRKEKNEHFATIFEKFSLENDTKKIFKTTRDLCGWNTDAGPRGFLKDGNIIRKPKLLANMQAEYYHEKIEKLSKKLSQNCTILKDPIDRLENALKKWSGRKNVPIFDFKKVTTVDTEKLVKKLGNSKSFGHEGIDASFLKLVLPSILIPLTHLINTSLSESDWACKWKLARTFPLLKDKSLDKLSPASYRPVSQLPTVSKIVEKAAQSQMLTFFEVTGQLNNSGHAYRSSLSTTSTIATITDELYQAAEDKRISQMMTIDQSAAFDCLDHEILVRKLEKYNLSEATIKWVRNYLSYRSQFVTIGAAKSNIKSLKMGVPQGSVIGPLLFSIYVNDLTETVIEDDCPNEVHLNKETLFGEPCQSCGTINMYADDATFNVSSKLRNRNKLRMETVLKKIENFLLENRLHMNVGKTTILECMIPQRRGKTPGPPPSLLVEEKPATFKLITDKGQCRVLGINFQSNLSWNSHLEVGPKALLPRIRKQLGALKQLGAKVPRKCRKTLASGFLLSKVNYLLPVWGNTTEKYTKKAQILINKAARWISGKRKRTKINILMESVNWLTIKELTKYHSCLLLWKTLHLEKPAVLKNRMIVDQDKKIVTSQTRLKFTARGWRWATSELWNQLPDSLRQEPKISKFKKDLKSWILLGRHKAPD